MWLKQRKNNNYSVVVVVFVFQGKNRFERKIKWTDIGVDLVDFSILDFY